MDEEHEHDQPNDGNNGSTGWFADEVHVFRMSLKYILPSLASKCCT